jgi:NB-ARC domain
VSWLEAAPGQDPVTLLAELARRLVVPESKSGFTTVTQGRDTLAAELRGKRLLVAVDNVWERASLDALTGLAPGCAVMFTTRLPELATTFGAAEIAVDELTKGQALELLGRWSGRAATELPTEAQALCTRVGNLALGVAMAGAMVARGGPSPMSWP